MKVILILTALLMGEEKPHQQAGEMKDLKTCEATAHKFLTEKIPSELKSKIVFRSAACAFVLPGKDA